MKIKLHDVPFEINVKRFYLPVTLTATCPECGKEVVRDCTNSYLSYPTANEPIDVHFYCYSEGDDGNEDEEHEFYEKVILRLTVEDANQVGGDKGTT